ncbi:unnamed protein product [Lactuca saligna]|uniref:Uncharacterized protein n=1 Tax=Lactuca saligna TaxID=75948 RepID=A0AA35Y3N7_LACSI|nr:unnamed protein product [Lactuca saligna]
MAKHISKKKKTTSMMIISTESTDEEDEWILETLEANVQKDTSTPSQTTIIPPKDSVAKSFAEEARTSDILAYVSNTDANVIIGEDDSKKDEQDSPTFENVIKNPFTSLFSSQSTDPPTTTSPIKESIFIETENESKGFGDLGGGNFVSCLEVDGLLKLLEGKITLKVSGMLKDSECRLYEKVDLCDQYNELRVNSQNSTFEGDLKALQMAKKERHVLFIQDVKKVCEDVNLKIQELHQYMDKEIACVRTDYASLNQKVDIIFDAVTKFAKLYESWSPQLSQLSTTKNKNFMEVITLLKELKELSTKPVSSSQLSSDFLLQKFSQFEDILLKQLAPLSRISILFPTTDAPSVYMSHPKNRRRKHFRG